MRLFSIATVLALGIVNATSAQSDDIKTLYDQFRAERAAAIKLGEPEDRFKNADQMLKKAQEAEKAQQMNKALRFVREARWAIPARPIDLPDHVERVIGYVRLRHADRVNDLAYTPDGKQLISASRDGTVRVWDLANGREVLAYRKHTPPKADGQDDIDDRSVFRIPAVAISPDGTTVASSGTGEIHIWELKTGKGKTIATKSPYLIRGLVFLKDGKSIATGGDDKIVRIFSLNDGNEKTAFPALSNRIEGLALSPNGLLLAATDANGVLSVFKTDGSDQKPVLSTQASDANSTNLDLLYLPDGTKIFTAGSDQNPRLTIAPGPKGETVSGMGSVALRFPGHASRINAAAITPDGALIATASEDETVRVWETASGKTIRHFQGLLSRATSVAIRPDGKQIATGTEDGSIRLWDLSASDEHRPVSEAGDSLWSAVFNSDGSRFASAGADRKIRVYETASGKLLQTLDGHKAAITSVCFLANDRLASASGDRTIKIWDTKTGQFLRDLTGHTSAVLALATDGTTLISGGVDRTVKSWDLDTGKTLWSWLGRSAVAAVAIRTGTKQIAVGTADGWLTILDLSSGTPTPIGSGQQAHVAGVADIDYSHDGTKLASVGGDGKFIVWSIGTDGTPSIINKDDSKKPVTGSAIALSAVAFSADSRLAASAGADRAIHIWDTNTGAELRTLRGHTDWVTALAFHPDGGSLLSAGVDHVARVFELNRTEESVRIGHAKAARTVAVSRDGRFALSGSDDTTAKLWDLKTGQELATFAGSSLSIYSVALVGEQFCGVGGEDMKFRLWNREPPRLERTLEVGQIYVLMSALDGKRIAIWSRDNQNRDLYHILDTEKKETPEPIIEADRKGLGCVTFSKDMSWVLSGDEEGKIRIWDTATRKPVGDDWPIHTRRVADIAVTSDRKTVIAVNDEGEVKIADSAKREVLKPVSTKLASIAGIMVSPTNDRFAVFGTDGLIKAYDLSGKELRTWQMPVSVNSLAFEPNGKKIVTANADGTLAVLTLP